MKHKDLRWSGILKSIKKSSNVLQPRVIILNENVSKVSVPSKTFNLLAVGCPLLAISNGDTEMYRLISKYHNGRCIAKTRIDEIVAYIRELKENAELKQLYAHNSLEASKDFTYRNAEKYLVED